MEARGVPTGVEESGRGHGDTPYDWTGLESSALHQFDGLRWGEKILTIIFTKEHDESLDGLDDIK